MKQEYVTRTYVYLMLTFFLFFTGFHGYTAIFTAKCAAFTVLSLLYIAVFAICKIPKGKLSLPELSALIYLAVTLVSAFASDHFPKTLTGVSRYEGLLTVGIYVTVFIFVSRSWKWHSSFVPFLSIVALLQSAVVIFQLLGFNFLRLYPKGVNYYIALERYNGEFISTVGNADIASAFFSLITPVLWVLLFGYKKAARLDQSNFLYNKKYRPLTLAAAVSSLFCTMAISVSAGVVAMAITAAVLPIVLFPEKRKSILAIILAVAILVLVLVYFLPLKDGTLFELQSLLKGNLSSDFGSGRIHIWSEVVENTKPLLGTGPDTMLLEDIEPFTKTVDGKTVTRKIDIAHNDYLNVLFHQGIFALAAYLGILTVLIKWYKNGRNDILVAAVGAGVFAYCVQVFFSFSACSSAIFFWIFIGILESESSQN